MSDLRHLKIRLAHVMKGREKEEEHDQDELERRMSELAVRRLRFSELGPELYDSVVEPRLELFAELAPDALYVRDPHRVGGTVALNRERRYAASIDLGFEVACDGQVEHVMVPFHLRIIPILIQFEREDTLSVPLSEMTASDVAAYVDSKLETAMTTLMKVTENPFYKREHIVIDPVCRMTFHEDQAAASIVHDGKRVFFCAATCKERFEDNPQDYRLS